MSSASKQKKKRPVLNAPRENRSAVFLAVFLIVIVGVAVYFNSFQGVFLLDDNSSIIDNKQIHSLSLPWEFLQNTRRPILYLSLAVNYALGGLNPSGYHGFNLIIQY